MKRRLDAWLVMLSELGIKCSVDTLRDGITAAERVKSEGDWFLTVTLSTYAKDLERSLAQGVIPSDAFQGYAFAQSGKLSGLPKLFGGFMDQIFCSRVDAYEGGRRHRDEMVLRDPSDQVAAAIQAVRQLCYAFHKEFAVCDERFIAEAIDSYVKVDSSLGDPLQDHRASRLFAGGLLDQIRAVTRCLYRNAICATESDLLQFALTPVHGPGATSDRFFGNKKWHFDYWPETADGLFPRELYALPNSRYHSELDQVRLLSQWDSKATRLIAVPKTQAKPRLIAAEPVVHQFLQQAVFRCLASYIAEDGVASRVLNLHDQEPNRILAERGSHDGSLATLDLSEASDRLPNWLVEDVFSDFPLFLEACQVTRTPTCQLPDGRVIPLQKFASMGSALTFPVESMVFSAIATLGVLRAFDLPITRRSVLRVVGDIQVFGDDIIVPSAAAETVIDFLETVGFSVNRTKSFWTGLFRESCGSEFFAGRDVSVVKFRKQFPTSLRDADRVISTVSTRNQLFDAGLELTAEWLDEEVVLPILGKAHYPYVLRTSPVLGRYDHSPLYQVDRLDPDLHAPQVRGYVEKAKPPKVGLDGYRALHKCLSLPGVSTEDPEHLQRSGRPRAVKLKLAWARPF